jgi:hypothetical protein
MSEIHNAAEPDIELNVNSATNSPENPEQSNAVERDELAEERFIALYTELTGASETQARCVYMYSDIIRGQDSYWYHLE